jgi:hypothetical protein
MAVRVFSASDEPPKSIVQARLANSSRATQMNKVLLLEIIIPSLSIRISL